MINLNPTDTLRVVTSSAAQIEVYAAWVEVTTATGVPVLDRSLPAHITTATTTTIVPPPASGKVRNVKHLNITNDHAGQSCIVSVEVTDGTTIIEMMAFTLLPGENMILNEEGRWAHRDAQGAEYPPAGSGAYDGFSVSFMKSGTAPDAVGYWYCTAKDGGFPGAWAPGTPGVNGRVTDGTTAADYGCIPIRNPATGANFLTEAVIGATTLGAQLFFDMLWINSGLVITTTTAQAFTVPTLPARDVNGTTNGEGCMIGIYCSSAIGLAAVASNAIITYVNSRGVGGRVATLSAIVGSQAPATPVIGTVVWFNLAAGDTGIQGGSWSLTLGTSWVSGTIHVFIARDLTMVGNVTAYVPVTKSISGKGVRLYNGTCALHCYLAQSTTGTFFNGELVIQEK